MKRVLFLGTGFPGKTALINRIAFDEFEDNQISSRMVYSQPYHQEFMMIECEIPGTIVNADLFLICFTYQSTIEQILAQYFNVVRIYGNSAKVLLVACKIDKICQNILTSQKIEQRFFNVINTSSKLGTNIKDLITEIRGQLK